MDDRCYVTVSVAQTNFDLLLASLTDNMDADVVAQLKETVETLVDATYDHGVNVGFISGNAKHRSATGSA